MEKSEIFVSFFIIFLFVGFNSCNSENANGRFQIPKQSTRKTHIIITTNEDVNRMGHEEGNKQPLKLKTKGKSFAVKETEDEESEEVEESESAEEVSSENEDNPILVKKNNPVPAVLSTPILSDPQGILSPWPGMDDEDQISRPVKQRETDQSKNWYTYESKQKGRYMGTPDGITDNAATLNKTAGSSGGGSKNKDRNMKNPYNVVRAKPHQFVDPSNYNFFQLQSKSKIGTLWISKGKKTGRMGLGSDEGADIDDLDEANKYDWQFRRYDRACLYQEYKKKKTDVKIPPVSEELKRLVDNQNEIMARKFLEWQFIFQQTTEQIALGELGNDHPHYYTYKFLQGTVQFFVERICKNSTNYVVAAAAITPAVVTQAAQVTASNPNSTFLSDKRNFLPESFVKNLFNLFLVLRNLTSSEHSKDYATKEDDANILEKILKECEKEEQPHWYHHSCGDQVLSVDYYHNYACTPRIDYVFNTRLYDPILDSVWQMFNAVHAFCFKHFQANIRMWHKYAMIIANAYNSQMRLRWKASVASSKFYTRLLGPDYEVNLEQINRCMFGTVLRSDVPMLLPRFDTPSVTTFGPDD